MSNTEKRSASRISPSTEADWSDEVREILGAATPASEDADGLGPPNILYTIGHHPALLPAFLRFASAIALRGVLPRRDSEILALRASWNCQSAFEWGHHVEYGEAEGLSAEILEAIAAGPEHPSLTEYDRLLLRAADELHAEQDLCDETFTALQERFDAAAIVELTFIVGNYTMLSMVAKATRVPLEDRLPPLPQA